MPTALELSREEWKRYTGLLEREAEHRTLPDVVRRERQALLARVRSVAAGLREQFGVERVVLFGSLAHEAWFDEHSDVDIAVWGLPHHAYWQAWRAAEEIITDRSVDLIQYEYAPRSLQQAIEHYGVQL
jgi:predicted nucleotidyltransferase